MAKLFLDSYEVTKNVTMDYPKHAESLDSTSSCFTSTPGQVLLRHTERNKTSITPIESGRKKKGGRWFVYPCKEKKTYPHIKELIQKALICRLEDTQGMRRGELKEDDPRRISSYLAPQEPPSSQVLLKEKISRF